MLSIRKTAVTAVAISAFGFGGAALAGAADDDGASSSEATSAQTRPQREALSSEVAAKVKAAALEEAPGATVLRTEAGGPYGSPYHAHVRASDGTLRVVLVSGDFEATAVQAERGRGGPGRGDRGGHHGGRGETPLTGTTKQKVEAAVKAKYPDATIERTETNTDGSAPYESHIITSAGTELEVLVSRDFEAQDAREHRARP